MQHVFGAGGDFSLSDDIGKTSAAFNARRRYLGGHRIGGIPDMLSTEELFQRLVTLIAETTNKWLEGKKVD
jgi:hypothetical protein